MREIFGEAWPELPRRRLRAHPAADRLPRHQLLHAQRDRARSRQLRRCARATSGSRSTTYTETGWEVYPAGARPTRWLGQGALRPHPALHHRERRRLLRSAAHDRRRRSRPAARRTTSASTSAPRTRRSTRASTCAATSPGRCSTTRVEPRLRQALRHRPRRLRDAAAHDQERARRYYSRGHPHQRRHRSATRCTR